MGESLTGAAVLWIVRHHATLAGFPLAPHDLRRTCARLCRLAGGDGENASRGLAEEAPAGGLSS